MRRFVLLAVVVGSQLAAGCYCYRPYLPRLQSGFGCSTGTCGTPLLGGGPGVLGGPGLRGYAAPLTVGAPLATYPSDPALIGGGYPLGDHATPPAAGCAGCGASAAGYPTATAGYPLSTVPPGYPTGAVGAPYSAAPPGYPSAQPAPMPMVMPSAMPGGVPHDSALLKMPTIVPPGGAPSTSKRPEELARQLPAGR